MIKSVSAVIFTLAVVNAFNIAPVDFSYNSLFSSSMSKSSRLHTPKALSFLDEALKMESRIQKKTMKPLAIEMIIAESAPVRSQYDQCLDKLEVIMNNVVEMARMCMDGKWQDTLPVMGKTVELLVEDVKCFMNPAVVGINPQCVVDHLNKVQAKFPEIMQDFKAQDWEGLKKDFADIVDILKDIQNC